MVYLVLILVLTVLVYLYYLRQYTKYLKGLERVPGPPQLPLLGNVLDFKSAADFLNKSLLLCKEYGPTYKLRMNPFKYNVITGDPKLIGVILNSPKNVLKTKDYDYMKDWLGEGLVTSKPEIWKVHRKMITPTFHFKILEDFVEVFSTNADIMITKLKQQVGNDSFDISPYYSLCALDAICETAMGVSINAQTKDNSEYVVAIDNLAHSFAYRSVSLFYKYLTFLHRFTRMYQAEKRDLEILQDFTTSIIQQRKRELKQKKTDEKQEDEFGIKRRKAFLDLLLEGTDFSDTEIRDEVDTIMAAGHDTTSTTLSFLMYCLAKNPHVQQRAYEEVRDIFGGGKTRPIVHRDLADMQYLEMVIKEALRIYPAAPMFSRELEEDLTFDGVTYPKGTDIVVYARAVHMNPEYFPDPEKFDPERFSSTSKISLYAYVPFSAGPRNCIGQKYAMLEMKTLLAKMLMNYEILPAIPEHHIELDLAIVLNSKNGIHIRIKERI